MLRNKSFPYFKMASGIFAKLYKYKDNKKDT